MLITGTSGVFVPGDGYETCVAQPDDFTTVTFSSGIYHIVFLANQPASICEFSLRVNSICNDGGALTITVQYYNSAWQGGPVCDICNIYLFFKDKRS